MKIQLISPFLKDRTGYPTVWRFPNTGLALLAALTPKDINVSILDEMYETINFEAGVDLVGISVTSNTAVRAYEVADRFRSVGVPVVLGGIHPTILPEEAIQHADAVLIGEAEGIWEQLVDDCKEGQLRQFYRSESLPSLENLTLPDRDLFKRDKYDLINLVQTTRGCPFSCDFCSVSRIYGNGVRSRPVDDVIAEVKTLKGDRVFFVDDNIFGRPDTAKKLLTGLIPLKKRWLSQASVNIANDANDLKLLRKSGCEGLFIGFETTSAEGLKEANKNWNTRKDYYEVIQKLHDNGISLVGSFIVGFDSDDKSCFEVMLDFAIKSKMEIADFGVLTPFPGTGLYDRFKEEKRLIDDQWWLRYMGEDVVYRPKQMSREELYEGWVWMMKEFYRTPLTLKRVSTGLRRRSFYGNILNCKANMGYRKNANSMPAETISL